MAVHRFFAPALDAGDESVTLPRAEAEHLTRVLRLGAGDVVRVFDGRGHEFIAQVMSTGRRDARLQIVSRVEPVPESAVSITLVPAVLKMDKMDELVRDATMLGVSALQPIVTGRVETTVAAVLRGARVERWQRIALASIKQCGRAVLPEIRTPLTFENWLAEPRPELTLMLVEPGAAAGGETLAGLRGQLPPSDAAVLVGPEGGWTDAEWQVAADRGVRLVTLGRRTLRADAVPLAALSVLQYLWGDL